MGGFSEIWGISRLWTRKVSIKLYVRVRIGLCMVQLSTDVKSESEVGKTSYGSVRRKSRPVCLQFCWSVTTLSKMTPNNTVNKYVWRGNRINSRLCAAVR